MRKLAAIAALALLAGCAAAPAATTTPTQAPPPVRVYTIQVSGTAKSADVTYRTQGGTQQATVTLPLRSTSGTEGIVFTEESAPDLLYISAQNTGAAGDVTCRILVNSEIVAISTSSIDYGIATCEYAP